MRMKLQSGPDLQRGAAEDLCNPSCFTPQTIASAPSPEIMSKRSASVPDGGGAKPPLGDADSSGFAAFPVACWKPRTAGYPTTCQQESMSYSQFLRPRPEVLSEDGIEGIIDL